MTDLDALWAELAKGAPPRLRRPDFRFSESFYAETYPDVPSNFGDVERHYRQNGRAEGRYPNSYRKILNDRPEIAGLIADIVVEPRLKAAIEAGVPDAVELAYELIRLGTGVDSIVSDFSGALYLKSNADVRRAKVDPLHHYLFHGMAEGRRSLRDLRRNQYKGGCVFDPARPTCLITAHELSRTGAPIVSLDLAMQAKSTHNVIFATHKTGPLHDAVLPHVCALVVTANAHAEFSYFRGEEFAQIDFAILNSAETFGFTGMLVAEGIPFASYIHEYAQYVFPNYKKTILSAFSDLLIYSSEHVRQSWMPVLKDIEFDVAGDSTVIPQRRFRIGGVDDAQVAQARRKLSKLIGRDCTRARIVCGAGHTQWRKGTDLFVIAAQIARRQDPDTIFVWVGDGLNHEDMGFGVWAQYHMNQVGAGDPGGNLFFLPAGDYYTDILTASDAMFMSSRLDPLPNVVFDALDAGCRIVLFDGASGYTDATYGDADYMRLVEYANPAAAAETILTLPMKTARARDPEPARAASLFARIARSLRARLERQRHFVFGESDIDLSILFGDTRADHPLRIAERQKLFRYRRRLFWRDPEEAAEVLQRSDNWIHRHCQVVPYATMPSADVSDFSIHVHAFYPDELPEALREHRAFQFARRLVFTTDTDRKAEQIHKDLAARGLKGEVVLVENRGRDILPFLELFYPGGAAGQDDLWCHLHLKKSIGSASQGDVWRRFLMTILLGDETDLSSAMRLIADPAIGLVAPFEPHFVGWTASRALLPNLAPRFPGPLPENPVVFPVGNMFWVRRSVVLAMNDMFGPDYPWPNEPIANDGTVFHLIERLWPAMSAGLNLASAFVAKTDQKRI